MGKKFGAEKMNKMMLAVVLLCVTTRAISPKAALHRGESSTERVMRRLLTGEKRTARAHRRLPCISTIYTLQTGDKVEYRGREYFINHKNADGTFTLTDGSKQPVKNNGLWTLGARGTPFKVPEKLLTLKYASPRDGHDGAGVEMSRFTSGQR